MSGYRFAGRTKSGRFIEIEVRAKSMMQAYDMAGVYLAEFFEVAK
ncbi:MAG: hypothetical protein RR068_17205 [Hafnia sp.]